MTAPAPHDDQGRAQREADWLRENAAALESSNLYVERYGLPLRRFWMLPSKIDGLAAEGQWCSPAQY
jgi:hypothetical protein